MGDGAYSLLLTDVAKEDEGVYKIEAEKDGTVAKSEAKLGVQGNTAEFTVVIKTHLSVCRITQLTIDFTLLNMFTVKYCFSSTPSSAFLC